MMATDLPLSPTPAVERELVLDMVKRGVWFAPVILLVATVIWGPQGTASAAVAIALVTLNLLLAAAGLSWAAKVSPMALMAVSLGGFALRMGLLCVVLLVLRNEPWVNMVALGITLVVTHLGLLFWELQYVSASLAYPGLKPTADKEAVVP